jgi:hypothetical protein
MDSPCHVRLSTDPNGILIVVGMLWHLRMKTAKMGKTGSDLGHRITISRDMGILRASVDSGCRIGLSIFPNGILIIVGGILAWEGKKG